MRIERITSQAAHRQKSSIHCKTAKEVLKWLGAVSEKPVWTGKNFWALQVKFLSNFLFLFMSLYKKHRFWRRKEKEKKKEMRKEG